MWSLAPILAAPACLSRCHFAHGENELRQYAGFGRPSMPPSQAAPAPPAPPAPRAPAPAAAPAQRPAAGARSRSSARALELDGYSSEDAEVEALLSGAYITGPGAARSGTRSGDSIARRQAAPAGTAAAAPSGSGAVALPAAATSALPPQPAPATPARQQQPPPAARRPASRVTFAAAFPAGNSGAGAGPGEVAGAGRSQSRSSSSGVGSGPSGAGTPAGSSRPPGSGGEGPSGSMSASMGGGGGHGRLFSDEYRSLFHRRQAPPAQLACRCSCPAAPAVLLLPCLSRLL